MIVYLGGVPGVGKTKVTKQVENLASEKGFALKRLRGTDILCELAGVSSVDELRRLPEEIRHELRPEMYRRIYAEDREYPNTVRLGDGHFCMFEINSDKFGTREMQPWDKDQVLGIIVLIAPPNLILERRKVDKETRDDRRLDLGSITYEQKMELLIAKQQSEQIGCPMAVFDNSSVDISPLVLEILFTITVWKKSRGFFNKESMRSFNKEVE